MITRNPGPNVPNNETDEISSDNDHTVIMIDLSHVAHSGQTLSATYVGSSSTVSESYILKPMLSGLSVNLTVLSSEDAIIAPICDTCSVISTQLKKIF